MPQTDKGGGGKKKEAYYMLPSVGPFSFSAELGEGERRDQKIGRSLISSEKREEEGQ